MKIRHIALMSIGLTMLPMTEARAEFWTALDTVPTPNVLIALDNSVTMGITPGSCQGDPEHRCHGGGNFPDPNLDPTRLGTAKRDLLATIPSFKDYFAFGGFRYRGCGRARATNHEYPDNTDLDDSFNRVEALIRGTNTCGSSERRYPDGTPVSAGCITATANCSGDQAVVDDILNGNVAGLTITRPATYNTPVSCELTTSPWVEVVLRDLLNAEIGGTSFNWPSFGSSPDVATVMNDLCQPLETALTNIQTDIQTCTATPSRVWDMSFLSTNWCDPFTISATLCEPPNPLWNSCICNPTQPFCAVAPIPDSPCGHQYDFKTRQQVAVCESYNPNTFGNYYVGQPDNVYHVVGSPLSDPFEAHCRENVVLYMTDGAFGDNPQLNPEAMDALRFYRSADSLANAFVFHVAPVFDAEADAMMTAVTGGRETQAFRADNADRMQESFAKILSRIYKGAYTGAPIVLSELGDRAFLHSFAVPGYDDPLTAPDPGVTDTYVGMPSRISVHEVYPDGTINTAPLYESDEEARVDEGTNGCGPVMHPANMLSDIAIAAIPPIPPVPPTFFPFFTPGSPGVPGVPARRHVDILGPAVPFGNAVSREVDVPANSTDRTGDGVPDPHPALTYGYSYGFANSAPVVVDAPKDLPFTANAAAAMNHMTNTQDRQRIIYYQSNGYILGLHGGERVNSNATTAPFGSRYFSYTYNDNVPYAGSEVLRYRPRWVDHPHNDYDYGMNRIVQQPILTGDLIVREAFIDGQFYTVLLGNGGRHSVGFFAIDVTDPCSDPDFVTEWELPSAPTNTSTAGPHRFASAAPNLYNFPTTNAPYQRAVLVTTSGLDADVSEMFVFDIRTGAELARINLLHQTGASYATSPVCVDATGEGFITQCYALRTDGLLMRVDVGPSALTNAADVTPLNASGNPMTMQTGRTFSTAPVAFFDPDGAVNILFGSGGFENLTAPPPAQNYVYKVKDTNTRLVGNPTNRTSADEACLPDAGGSTSGEIALPTDERVISKPIVQDGLVAWTTYVNETTGCTSGTGRLYVMDFYSCFDIIPPSPGNPHGGLRPEGEDIGAGLPASPTLHTQSQRLLVNSSAGPTANQVAGVITPNRGLGRAMVKPLFWRLEVNSL